MRETPLKPTPGLSGPPAQESKTRVEGAVRRPQGAGTAIIGLTNGNYAAAQELLRHKHMTTTLQFCKKQTLSALNDGVKALEAALKPKTLTAGDGGEQW